MHCIYKNVLSLDHIISFSIIWGVVIPNSTILNIMVLNFLWILIFQGISRRSKASARALPAYQNHPPGHCPQIKIIFQGIARRLTIVQDIVRRLTIFQGIARRLTIVQGIARRLTISQGIARRLTISQGIARRLTISQGNARRVTSGYCDAHLLFQTLRFLVRVVECLPLSP